MKSYTVHLTGGVKIPVNEEQKQKLERFWKSGESTIVTLGLHTIDTKSIKGIYGVEEPDYTEMNKADQEDFMVWVKYLRDNVAKTSMEKARREWDFRIIPGLKLAKVQIPKRYEVIIKKFILEFFDSHPMWPYADVRVWWPYVRYCMRKQTPMSTKYFEIVMRQDGQVKKFMDYQKGTI